jgi:hypothetical protein
MHRPLVPNYGAPDGFVPKERFIDLCILAVGLMNTINTSTATIPQRTAIKLLEGFLGTLPPSWRGDG